jgi:hypothetical protein
MEGDIARKKRCQANGSTKISENIKDMKILHLSRSTDELTHDANR